MNQVNKNKDRKINGSLNKKESPHNSPKINSKDFLNKPLNEVNKNMIEK